MQKEEYAYYMNLKNPNLDPEIEEVLRKRTQITKVDYKDVNKIFDKEKLQNEIGFIKLENGDYLVAMKTEMPDVSPLMARWWFWWHPQKKERYQIWYPGEHLSSSYSFRNKSYYAEGFNPFKENTVYPVERVGKKTITLSIAFVHPQKFGISEANIRKTEKGFLLCGFVGIMKGIIQHTKMLHYFKPKGNGVELISRFWLGNGLPKILKGIAANEEQAFEMAKHCSIEYNRLAMILPELYNKYK
ncbi:MAG TPA: hypothetical protein VMU29_07085 [Smithella sp.]|nr:hypothetical protein [Smithella sp.]